MRSYDISYFRMAARVIFLLFFFFLLGLFHLFFYFLEFLNILGEVVLILINAFVSLFCAFPCNKENRQSLETL